MLVKNPSWLIALGLTLPLDSRRRRRQEQWRYYYHYTNKTAASTTNTAQREQIKEEITPQARERVRQLILIERIREKEGIIATPSEVDAQIQNLASQYQMTPENLKKRMEMTGSVSQLVTNINYNKAVDWLYGQAKVNVIIEEPESGSEGETDEPDGS